MIEKQYLAIILFAASVLLVLFLWGGGFLSSLRKTKIGSVSSLRNYLVHFIHFKHDDCAVSGAGAEKQLLAHKKDAAVRAYAREELFGRQLAVWVANGNYTKQGITINDVAAELNTNRTYLSAYINGCYGCPFRNWINSLRIERVKQMMKESPESTIDYLAQEMGYASKSHFIRVFTETVGQSPTKWRSKQE